MKAETIEQKPLFPSMESSFSEVLLFTLNLSMLCNLSVMNPLIHVERMFEWAECLLSDLVGMTSLLI